MEVAVQTMLAVVAKMASVYQVIIKVVFVLEGKQSASLLEFVFHAA